MSHPASFRVPAYYGRPALVAGYRRARAPASVHLVALTQYIIGLAALLAAGGVLLLLYGHGRVIDEQRMRVPAEVLRRVEQAQAGVVMAGATGVIALMWLIIARALQRGQQWARVTVLMLSVLAIAGTGYAAWRTRFPATLGGIVLPGLYLMLLNTRAARAWFRWSTW